MMRGINDDQAIRFAEFAREKGVSVRFIEFMPLDNGKVWRREMVIPGEEMRDSIDAVFPLEPVKSEERARPPGAGDSQTARRAKSALSIRSAALLRPLQPHSVDRRRHDPHLPVFHRRTQYQTIAAQPALRGGSDRFHSGDHREKRRPPPHQRSGVCPASEYDVLHRRINESLGWRSQKFVVPPSGGIWSSSAFRRITAKEVRLKAEENQIPPEGGTTNVNSHVPRLFQGAPS